MSLNENIQIVKSNILGLTRQMNLPDDNVQILAATKTVSFERINELCLSGIKLAGENRVQEFLEKYDHVKNIDWHFIGVLQTNKVKYIIDKVSLIHSLDRCSLADEIDHWAKKIDKIQDVLIEINAGGEDSKSGVAQKDFEKFYHYCKQKPNIRIKGIMPVLPIEANENLYKDMGDLFSEIRSSDKNIEILSMGMSNDYLTAIKYGANLVRLGSIIFGERV